MTPREVTPAGPPVVFVSYSLADSDWLGRFGAMLQPLVRNRRLELWTDRQIETGEDWRQRLADAIERAAVALLLVSPDFLTGDFIIEHELPALTEHGVTLAPVLLRPCMFDAVPELESVQWLHDPRRDGPLSLARDVEGGIVRVCRTLMTIVDGHTDQPERASRAPSQRVAASVPALAPSRRLGKLHGVPHAPQGFVDREEFGPLRAAMLAEGRGSLGITGRIALGLYGQGGIGKTVTAAALARDEVVRRHFPDGVFWVTVGERADLVATQLRLLEALDTPAPGLRSSREGRERLREALSGRRCLIVVDDAWTAAAAEAFAVADSEGRVLYTTRDRSVLDAMQVDAHEIDELSTESARALLAALTATTTDRLPPEVDRVLEATGCVALALAIVGAAVGRGGRVWAQIATDLEQAGTTFLDHPYANTFKAIVIGVSNLPAQLREAYESLVVYPEDTPISVAAFERWWLHQQGPTTPAREVLAHLAEARLVAFDGRTFLLHDLGHAYLRLHTESVRLLHDDLLQTYRALLPVAGAPWRELPPGEDYIWEHLVEHLYAAGDAAGAKRVATDLGHLARRCLRHGPHAAEADVRRVAASDNDEAVRWVRQRIMKFGHILSGHGRLGDLAATLFTRIGTPPDGVDTDSLYELLPDHLLAPIWGLPEATDALIRFLEVHGDGVRAVQFSPDGRLLASAGDDETVRIWAMPSATLSAVLEAHVGGVWGLAFSPDASTLASASDDCTIRLWDVATGVETATLRGHEDWVRSVAFSPDGRSLASAGDDKTIRLWDPFTASPRAVLHGHEDWVLQVAFSPDGTMLASVGADSDSTVRLWDVATAKQTAILVGGVSAVAFSPDGRTLASAEQDFTVALWDLATATRTTVLTGHARAVWCVTFSPDGRTLASAGDDQTIRLWDLAAGNPVKVFDGHAAWVAALAFSPDGRWLASGSDDRTVGLWDPTGDTPTGGFDGHTRGVRSVALAPDASVISSASSDATVRLWDAYTGTCSGILHGHDSRVRCVAFSPDGRTLASAGDDHTVRLWNLADETQDAILQGHHAWVRAVGFSPDGRLLASVGDDGTVRLWDIPSRSRVAVLRAHGGGVWTTAFSADGRWLASGGDDQAVRLWDPSRAEPVGVLDGHAGGVSMVAFSDDGRILASAGVDRTIRLWNLDDMTEAAVLVGHTDEVSAVVFAAGGNLLASGGLDQTVRLWSLPDGSPTASVRLGASVLALAADDRDLVVGVDRAVAKLRIIDRPRRTQTPAAMPLPAPSPRPS